MATNQGRLKVFLCHANENESLIQDLKQRLHTAGFDPWVEGDVVLPGMRWEDAIEKALQTTDAVIVCLSAFSVKNEGLFHAAIQLIREREKLLPSDALFMIPLRFDGTAPPAYLRRLAWADYHAPDSFERIVKSLNLRAAQLGKRSGGRARSSKRAAASVRYRAQTSAAPRDQRAEALRAIQSVVKQMQGVIQQDPLFEFGDDRKIVQQMSRHVATIQALVKRLDSVYRIKPSLEQSNQYFDVIDHIDRLEAYIEAVDQEEQGSRDQTARLKRRLEMLARSIQVLSDSEGIDLGTERSPQPRTARPVNSERKRSSDDTIKELEKIEDNQHNLRRLRTQLRTPIGVIPFVGAGLSMPFGFPSWGGFLLDQARKAGIEPRIKRRLAKGEYEEAAEDLLNARRRRAFYDAIGNAFGLHNLIGKELKGAVCLVPRLTSGVVITTNFDHVLEEVFKQNGTPFEREIWGANADISTEALVQQRRFLIKIHGDAGDSANRVLTKSDYARQYGSSDGTSIDFALPLPGLLRRVLLGRALLFLGCSLNQDRTIAVLEEISKSDSSIAHYAIVEQPKSKQQFHARSQSLSEHNIRPIWFPNGRFDLIEPLLAYLLEPKS